MSDLEADELDEMTKDELLAYGQELGLTPMNHSMTKDEIRAVIDEQQGEPPQVEGQVTTTMTKDFLNRGLVNPTPGTSNATDFLGRAVIAGNRDYMSRILLP